VVVVEEENAEAEASFAKLLLLLPHHLHLLCVRFLLLIPYQGPLAAKMRG
jgi:hypothetical protein